MCLYPNHVTYLVSEDFDFAVGSVYRLCSLTLQVLVRIYNHMQGVPLHSLLR